MKKKKPDMKKLEPVCHHTLDPISISVLISPAFYLLPSNSFWSCLRSSSMIASKARSSTSGSSTVGGGRVLGTICDLAISLEIGECKRTWFLPAYHLFIWEDGVE